jgi:hypothetical protein
MSRATEGLREEIREANLSVGHLLWWVGLAVASSFVATAVLSLIHRTPVWLLAGFAVGVMLMGGGAILLRIDKLAGRNRDWVAERVADYKRRLELSLFLRQRADLIADQYVSLREWAQMIGTNTIAKQQFNLGDWIDSFTKLAESCADAVAADGLSEEAERFRVQVGEGDRLVPPAATAQGKLESVNDLLNVMTQYRDSLTVLASKHVAVS